MPATSPSWPAARAPAPTPWATRPGWRSTRAGDVYVAEATAQRVQEIRGGGGARTPPPQLVTVAGTGTAGFNGDGLAGTASELDQPTGVAVDGAGDVFIADTANCRVRVLPAHDGTVFGHPVIGRVLTTVAGTGVCGSAGQGGPMTGAELSNPVALALDGPADLLVADGGDQSVLLASAAGGTYWGTSGRGGRHRRGRRWDGGLRAVSRGRAVGDRRDGRAQRPPGRGGRAHRRAVRERRVHARGAGGPGDDRHAGGPAHGGGQPQHRGRRRAGLQFGRPGRRDEVGGGPRRHRGRCRCLGVRRPLRRRRRPGRCGSSAARHRDPGGRRVSRRRFLASSGGVAAGAVSPTRSSTRPGRRARRDPRPSGRPAPPPTSSKPPLSASPRTEDLTVNGSVTPWGRPRRLLLRLDPPAAGPQCHPSAYQIRVRRTDPGHADAVWDSGTIDSARQAFVLYAGPALAADAPYSWTVRARADAGPGAPPRVPPRSSPVSVTPTPTGRRHRGSDRQAPPPRRTASRTCAR